VPWTGAAPRSGLTARRPPRYGPGEVSSLVSRPNDPTPATPVVKVMYVLVIARAGGVPPVRAT
jgi:hypothetical protein